MKNKTATGCRNILRSELDRAIDRKSRGNGLRKGICQKRHLGRLNINRHVADIQAYGKGRLL